MLSKKETSWSPKLSVVILALCVLLFEGCKEEEQVDRSPKYLVHYGSTSAWVEAEYDENVRTISAQVLAADSTPKADVTVFFKIESGEATLSHPTATTDSEGIASVDVVCGSKVGDLVVAAEAYGLTGSPLAYYFYIRAGIPSAIEKISGDHQEALPNTRLPDEFLVKVTDKFGNPVPQANVEYQIKQGGGKLLWVSSRTDNDGIAKNRFTVGETPLNLVAAKVGNVSTDFTAYTLLAVALDQPLSQKDGISLAWSQNVNPTFSHYSIHRSLASSYNFEQIGAITDEQVTTFTDYTALIGQPYTYFIRVTTVNEKTIDSKQKNAESGEYVDLISPHHARDIVMNGDRSLLYISDPMDKMIRVLSTDPLRKVDSILLINPPNRMNLSADGTKLYVTVSFSASFMVVDLATKSVLQTIDISTPLNSTSITDVYQAKNGQLFATGYGGYILRIDEANDFAAQRIADNKVFFAGSPTFVGDHNDYLYVAESNLSPNSLIKIDMSLQNAPLILEAEHGYVGGTRDAVVSPDGKYIYTTSGQKLNTDNFKTEGQFQTLVYGIQLSGISNTLFGSFSGGSFFNKGKFAVVDPSTLLPKSEMYIGFVSSRVFLSADEKHAILIRIDHRENYRIFKINIPL